MSLKNKNKKKKTKENDVIGSSSIENNNMPFIPHESYLLTEFYEINGNEQKKFRINQKQKFQHFQDYYYKTFSFFHNLSDFFLPEGFPQSVTSDYLSFQIWDSIQGLCSYLRGILCVQAILEGIGVGDEYATANAAAVQWIFRDGIGMIGGLFFGWKFSFHFGFEVKKWRLFADIINDVGLTLELLSVHFPSYFLFFLCLSSIFRSICGLAAGATRVNLIHHFALNNNITDLQVKEGNQETLITILGMILGLYCQHLIGNNTIKIWILFILLTILHVFANYYAMTSLLLNDLNYNRLYILIRQYLSHLTPSISSNPNKNGSKNEKMSIYSINKNEGVWFLFFHPFTYLRSPIIQSVPLHRILSTSQDYLTLLQNTQTSKYFLSLSSNGQVLISHELNISSHLIIQSFFQAIVLYIKNKEGFSSIEAYQQAFNITNTHFSIFIQDIIDQGWNTQQINLNIPHFYSLNQKSLHND